MEYPAEQINLALNAYIRAVQANLEQVAGLEPDAIFVSKQPMSAEAVSAVMGLRELASRDAREE